MKLEGIILDNNGKYIFDKKLDLDTDILQLATDISGEKITKNLTYLYGYQFNNNIPMDDIKRFRTALKHNIESDRYFYNDDVYDFIEDGIFRLDAHKRLDNFKVLITIESTSSEKSIVEIMKSIIEEYTPACFMSFELIKKLCKNVTFNEDKAIDALKNTEKYGYYSYDDLYKIVHRISEKFNKATPDEKFKIKRYQPVLARIGFSNFLDFKSKMDEYIYKNLDEGTEVLVCDDFITSGSSLKEILDFLTKVNPNNKLTAFALIDQLRAY